MLENAIELIISNKNIDFMRAPFTTDTNRQCLYSSGASKRQYYLFTKSSEFVKQSRLRILYYFLN